MTANRSPSSPKRHFAAPTRFENYLRTFIGVLFLPAALFWYSSRVLVGVARGESARALHRFYVGFARSCLRVAATDLEVRGEERIEPGCAYVVVANHESAWDPSCIVASLPGLLLRFVAKSDLTRIPVFGNALLRSGNVRVVRTETSGDAQRIQQGFEHRDPEVSLLFFAEGGRSIDGALHTFKKGAFVSAIGYGLPVLPLASAGTFSVWPKGKLQLRRGTVVIEVGEPIPTDSLEVDDRTVLRDQVWNTVAALRKRASATAARTRSGSRGNRLNTIGAVSIPMEFGTGTRCP